MENSQSLIRIGGVPEHFNLPWKLWLQENPPEASSWLWQDFPGGSGAMVQALNDKKLDLALILTEAAAHAELQKANLKCLTFYVQSPLIWGIFSGSSNPISESNPVPDIKYAISRFGSGSHLMAKVDALLKGKTIEDHQFVLVQNLEGAKTALSEMSADLFFWEKWMTQPLVDQGTFKLIGERPTPWPAFVLVAEKTFWENEDNHEKVKLIFNGVLILAKKLKAGPEAHQEIAKNYGLKPENARKWLQHVEWTSAWQNPESEIEKAKEILVQIQKY